MLGYHLSRGHSELSISDYRQKWGDDMPMTAKDGVSPKEIDFPPEEMTIREIADQVDYLRDEIAQLEGRLSELETELDTRRQRIQDLDDIFQSLAKSD